MKRLLMITFLITVLTTIVIAANVSNYSEQGGAEWHVGGLLQIDDGGEFYMYPTDTTVTASEGYFYFDDSENCPKYYNGTGWIALTSGTGDNTLDNAYDQGGAGSGRSITADTGAVAISNTDADTAFLLALNASPTSAAALGGLEITVGANSTENGIEFENSGSGDDIHGTGDTWAVTKTGDATFSSETVLTSTITTANIANLNISSAMTNAANFTLDDGTTDSPAFTLKDETDETCAIVKKDDGDTEVTIPSDTDFEIVTGNLAVGNGTPGTVSMDGEDFYVDGDSEFNGTVQFDGVVTTATTLSCNSTLDVNEDVDIDFDAADEEVSIVNSAQYGADGAQVTIQNTDADVTAAMYLLRLRYTDDGQANADFAVFEDNNGDDMITFTDGGSITAAGTVQGATLQATTLLNVDEDVDIDFDANDEEFDLTTSATDYAADSAVATIYASGAGATNNTYLLRLRHAADGDAQDHFMICEDNDGDDMFKVDSGGAVTMAGTATFSGGQTRMVRFDPKVVEFDGTNPPSLTDFGTDGQCNISVLAFDADGGATGDDIAYISWKVPDGYITDSARLNVAYTFSDAEDAADEAQFDFAVNAIAAGESLDAAGTALADQTTVIADASTGAGKLYVSQYNIETEDIAVDDLVTIEIAVDEDASALSVSGTLDVLYFEIEYESTE